MSILGRLKGLLYPAYRTCFVRATLYAGELRTGKGPMKLLFLDSDRFASAVLPKLYGEPPTTLRTFRCWIPGLRRLLSSPGLDWEICIANLPIRYRQRFAGIADYTMQTRVTQTLDITAHLSANRRYLDRRRGVQSKIRKHGLSCRVSNSPDDFDFFYHRMARPLYGKFGDAAMEDTYDELRPFFDRGVLILVLQEDTPVAGVICYGQGDCFTAYRSGLLDGDQSYANIGAMSAWYHFLLEYAREQGYRKVDFMRSLPFLNDGVYKTKQHWGASTGPYPDAPTCVFLFNRRGPGTLARFVEALPLIVRTPDGLDGVISLPDDTPLTPDLSRSLISLHGAPGLGGLQIVRPSGPTGRIPLQAGC